MSRCEKCNYSKGIKGLEKAACEFAKYMHVVDEAKTDMGFPCDDADYQEYLNKKIMSKEIAMDIAS